MFLTLDSPAVKISQIYSCCYEDAVTQATSTEMDNHRKKTGNE